MYLWQYICFTNKNRFQMKKKDYVDFQMKRGFVCDDKKVTFKSSIFS